MTPKKGFKFGLMISLVLIMLILMGFTIAGLRSYDGYCISFEPPPLPCNIIEYLIPFLILRIFFPFLMWPVISYLVAILLLILPFVGYILGEKTKTPELVE